MHEKNEFSVKINFFMSKEDVLTSSMFQLWLKCHLKKKQFDGGDDYEQLLFITSFNIVHGRTEGKCSIKTKAAIGGVL